MRGWPDVLAFQFEFFEHLFSGAQANEVDLDVAVRFEAGETDQVAHQVENADGLTHIQNKDFSALAHARRLQYQLHRLGNGHEVTPGIRMRDRHRTTGGD